jgi:hypothetical protein
LFHFFFPSKIQNSKFLPECLLECLKHALNMAPIVGALWRMRRHVTPNILDNIYFAYVHSHISYLISLWGMAGSTRLHTIEVLQNKALKNLRGLPRLFPSKNLYSEKILPIKYLKDYEMILITYKIIKNKFKYSFSISSRSDIHGYNTRNAQNINLPQFRLSIGRNSFSYDAFKKYNELPIHIKNTNCYIKFKNSIKKLLFQKYTNEHNRN